ncbi:MAG: hypothetical protein WCQ97_01585 [Aminobacterium sp.]|jgi:hypothetical protein|uniref:DUF340 domain-containing protein n=1 Tax=bioreactor metagenome TaxID=1076179 RepID=A0A645J0F7_9ZZZZ|nr:MULTISPECIES: hypothetical protein [unclassified Aminobacterium]MDD2206249.1 hypothetical protein [Aminobacterium sp.]MDD3425804.1 hypothetical protein [Aminobacterium sp.]MDD3707556.1 hypothetical protein [Aminobacterium sp.]MDD4229308.1 hypothetical protein [Aminobacterium sp.]MDD4552188.1 hypothetical protein [Aminobacterium sp.]
MKTVEVFFVLIIIGVITLVGNLVGFHTPISDAIPGMAFLIVLCLLGVICSKVIPVRIPSVAYIVTIGCIVTYPGFPGAEILTAWAQKVSFLALTTPILAYAGISLGKDLDMLKRTGWRIIVVSCVVFVGTYIGSAIIAQGVLKLIGEI